MMKEKLRLGREEVCLKLLSEENANELAGDVIFVHGMGGDLYETWAANEQTRHWGMWLAEERPDLRFLTLGYPASPSHWLGRGMPLQDRATSILALLSADRIGKRPLCFVTHSLGGLLVKQMLQEAISGGTKEYKQMMKAVKGVVFLSTPHTGSNIATIVNRLGTLLRTTEVIEDLQDNGAMLRKLNQWYVNHIENLRIRNKILFEKWDTKGFRIVDESSGGITVKGETAIPIDADHFGICKPESKDALVYKITRQFINEIFPDSRT